MHETINMTQSQNPYFSVWFKSGETINKVLAGDVSFKFYIPILLAALSAFIGDWKGGSIFVGSLIVIVVGTAMLYFISSHFLPWLILKTGNIWKGQANMRKLKLVFGLAHIPLLPILILQLLTLPLGQIQPPDNVNNVVQIIAWIFNVRILIIGISKVQGFTYGLAILNIVLSVLPFVVLRLMME